MTGRPTNASGRDIASLLKDKVREWLTHSSHLDLTVRKLASVAGVHPNMVRYYYGGIEELLAVLVNDQVERANARLTAVEKALAETPNPTAAIIEALTEAYYPDDVIARIMIIESLKPRSKFMSLYESRQRWRLFNRIETMIRRLVTLGVYRADLDCYYATFSLLSLVAAPLSIGRLEEADGMKRGFDAQRWQVHVTDMLHRSFSV